VKVEGQNVLRIAPASSPSEFALARRLFEEYAAQLGVDLCFQEFHAELGKLDSMYGPPAGCLLLAWQGDRAVGCGALRRLRDTDCEMKRLYLRDGARGLGYGRQLAVELVARARELGYRRMLLDTLDTMTPARRLYHSLGFRECAAYYSNPLPGVRYLELELSPPPA
jgi:GNAT superfamily N-acetyltransferase